jgi:hypothetical protein
MSKIEDGGPAFPTPVHVHADYPVGMTLRQYAAIKLRVPNSGTDWLDEMIVQSLRDEFAAKVLQGLMASRQDSRFLPKDDAKHIYAVTDAVLKARES